MLGGHVHTQTMPEDRSVLSRQGPPPHESHSYGSSLDQVVDLYLPPASVPRHGLPVVFVHGGYWRPEYDRTHARSAAGALADAGWVTALIEYRRIPGEPDAMTSDVINAIETVTEILRVERVIVVGHSAGGHLALVAAHRSPSRVRAAIALAPLSNLALAEELDLDDGAVRAFLGTGSGPRTDLDPHHLGLPSVPVRILHGIDDSVVPAHMSTAFGERWCVSVQQISDIGHYELIDPLSSAWGEVLPCLEELAQENPERANVE